MLIALKGSAENGDQARIQEGVATMGNVQMHESLANVVNNGDGAFTITRDKLIALVQGQAFLDVYDNADVDEVDSGMDDAYHYALGGDYESAWDYAVDQVAAFEARSFA